MINNINAALSGPIGTYAGIITGSFLTFIFGIISSCILRIREDRIEQKEKKKDF